LPDPKSNRSLPFLGDWDQETIRMDYDNMALEKVDLLNQKAESKFRLQGSRVFYSSLRHYHTVFNRRVTWEKNCQVMAWIAVQSHSLKVKDYVLMQIIKGNSTLRIGPKGDKPSPRTIHHEGKQDGQIRKFLLNRRFIKDTMKRISRKRKSRGKCR
jgi:hypothetical protein